VAGAWPTGAGDAGAVGEYAAPGAVGAAAGGGGVWTGAGAAVRTVMSAATGAGSQSSGRRRTVSAFAVRHSSMISGIDGRPAGSLVRQRVTSSLSRSGTPLRSGSSWTIR
jgi:hypothetical protein